MRDRKSLEVIEDQEAGTREYYYVRLPELPNGAPMSLPVAAVRGIDDGPTIWISAAVHGDEINGVDIVRNLLRHLDPTQMAGTVLALPIVDVYGFNQGDRYLPDGRDLNRSFPGSRSGSLASRVANVFVTEIVDRCDAGIDLHTGSGGRSNLPQTRGVLSNPQFLAMSAAFAAPVTMNSKVISGSMREVAKKRDKDYLLYEAGAAGSFDPASVTVGTEGCLRVLEHLGLIADAPPAFINPVVVSKGSWVRSPRSGVLDHIAQLGDFVTKGDVLGTVTNTFGEGAKSIKASRSGIVVGMAVDPLVQGGDAAFHIGTIADSEAPPTR